MTNRLRRLALTIVVRLFVILGFLKPWNRSVVRIQRLALGGLLSAASGIAGLVIIQRVPSVGLAAIGVSAVLGVLTITAYWLTR